MINGLLAIGALLDRSVRRRWRHLAAERLDTVEPVVPLGKTFWPLSSEERASLTAMLEDAELHALLVTADEKNKG